MEEGEAPFWPQSFSEMFHRKLDEALEDLDGVFSIVDDVIIVGRDPTEAEAQMDNQRI